MATIKVELDETKAALLREKAARYGLKPEQFVIASIEDLLSTPDPDFEKAASRVLAKNRELYKRLS